MRPREAVALNMLTLIRPQLRGHRVDLHAFSNHQHFMVCSRPTHRELHALHFEGELTILYLGGWVGDLQNEGTPSLCRLLRVLAPSYPMKTVGPFPKIRSNITCSLSPISRYSNTIAGGLTQYPKICMIWGCLNLQYYNAANTHTTMV